MTSERWVKIKELFTTALELNPLERTTMLKEECGSDEELRGEVESLLTADALDSPLFDSPIVDIVAEHIASLSSSKQGEGLEIGTVLDGRYGIEKELGRGGMGVVYLAKREHMLGDRVVVKVLLEKHLQDSYVVQKFKQEMESLLRIEHPGIVKLLDAGQTPQGAPYLVMKYVEGYTLRTVIQPEGMHLLRGASIIRQVCEALSAAHQEKVFHRDLKPENIMLCQTRSGEEQAKVIDFGVAKIKNSMIAPSTAYPITVGTAAYMAPEQLGGKPVSAATDIYALGIIAHELVTGRRPFVAESPHQLMELQRMGIRVHPRDLRPALPKAAESAILKALSFMPEHRYQQAEEFGADFWRALAVEKEPSASAASARKSKRRLITGLAFIVLLVALAGAVIFLRTRPPITEPPKVPESRVLNYWVKVLKYRGGKPYGAPFRLSGEINFERDYRIRLHLSSPQTGYLYIINERPGTDNGVPAYNLLFPDPTINGGSAIITNGSEIQIPQKNWFAFDEEEGIEKIWLIYSAQSVAEIEAVRGVVNPDDMGFIGDRARAVAIQKFISQQAAAKPEVVPDDERKETRVQGTGDVIVHLLRLEHH
jgi:serine/threonine protein kinase